MPRAVIFCNGDILDYAYHKSQLRADDYIIAADGGGNHCKILNLKPHLALGDFDSLDSSLLEFYRQQGVEMLTVPTDKNFIDLVLAIDSALERNYQDIVIFGGLGGRRIDMELANVLLLAQYDAGKIAVQDEKRSISLIDDRNPLTLRNCKGCYFSLIPLSEKFITGESQGLLYQLLDLEFTFGETRSVSNEVTQNLCTVQVKKGKALAICQKK